MVLTVVVVELPPGVEMRAALLAVEFVRVLGHVPSLLVTDPIDPRWIVMVVRCLSAARLVPLSATCEDFQTRPDRMRRPHPGRAA